jgi:hypothetical protein
MNGGFCFTEFCNVTPLPQAPPRTYTYYIPFLTLLEIKFVFCCRLLEVDWLKNIWRPDSFFKNAKSVTFQTMTVPNHYIWLYKDKTILYMVK